MGSLYRHGHTGWVKYYVDGHPVRESTGVAIGDSEAPPAAARDFLKVREGAARISCSTTGRPASAT